MDEVQLQGQGSAAVPGEGVAEVNGVREDPHAVPPSPALSELKAQVKEAEQQLFNAVEEKKQAEKKEHAAFNKVLLLKSQLPCARCVKRVVWSGGLCFHCWTDDLGVFSAR